MWDEHPVWSAYRVTAWGINRASYLFGWGGYYNPYPVEPYYVGDTYIDYSQPLVTYAPMEQYVPADEYAAAVDPGVAVSMTAPPPRRLQTMFHQKCWLISTKLEPNSNGQLRGSSSVH